MYFINPRRSEGELSLKSIPAHGRLPNIFDTEENHFTFKSCFKLALAGIKSAPLFCQWYYETAKAPCRSSSKVPLVRRTHYSNGPNSGLLLERLPRTPNRCYFQLKATKLVRCKMSRQFGSLPFWTFSPVRALENLPDPIKYCQTLG